MQASDTAVPAVSATLPVPDDRLDTQPIRIVAAAETWEGADGAAYIRAFRRQGHSVAAVEADRFVPSGWRSRPLRLLLRLIEPAVVREYNRRLISTVATVRPHLFFVYKGRNVTAETIDAIRALGATAINVYPDVSFMVHGPHLPMALPRYDWIFQTKRFGIVDLERRLGMTRVSFIPHAFDPEVHRPVPLDQDDNAMYDCDVSFIGTWSPKKADIMRTVCQALPDLKIRIWGGNWQSETPDLARWVEGRGVIGVEFAKALRGSRINIAILSEAKPGASSGDQTTSRTFHIPAAGAFMLHERTTEFLEYFDEGVHCGCFGSAEELVEQIRHYLARPAERERIAAAGRERVISGGHSVDCRVATVLEKVRGIRNGRDAR